MSSLSISCKDAIYFVDDCGSTRLFSHNNQVQQNIMENTQSYYETKVDILLDLEYFLYLNFTDPLPVAIKKHEMDL